MINSKSEICREREFRKFVKHKNWHASRQSHQVKWSNHRKISIGKLIIIFICAHYFSLIFISFFFHLNISHYELYVYHADPRKKKILLLINKNKHTNFQVLKASTVDGSKYQPPWQKKNKKKNTNDR